MRRKPDVSITGSTLRVVVRWSAAVILFLGTFALIWWAWEALRFPPAGSDRLGVALAVAGVASAAAAGPLFWWAGRESKSAADGLNAIRTLPHASEPKGTPIVGAANYLSFTPAAARDTLPRDLAVFTGRSRELRRLAESASQGGTVGIHVIDGTAGIGKTTFAIHAAHQLASEFPDGQYFINLRAHLGGEVPVDPINALGELLSVVGVAGDKVLPERRAALWRDYSSRKKLLLLLDDAASHLQVEPLLPGGTGNLVLITSRRRLSELDDVVPVSLDPLSKDQAVSLFLRLAQRDCDARQEEAAATVVEFCGYLPLAIRFQAGRLRDHPSWTASDLAAELTAAQSRLGEFDPVVASYDLSYENLSAQGQRLLRLLSFHPGPGFDNFVAAAIISQPIPTARQVLGELSDNHLIDEFMPGSFDLHDLVREYAGHRADASKTSQDINGAVSRMLEYYLAATQRAGLLLHPPREAGKASTKGPPEGIAPLQDYDQALRWCDTRREVLVASVGLAAKYGFDALACKLASNLKQFLSIRKHWDDWMHTSNIALSSARQLGDQRLEARILRGLASLYCDLHRFDEAQSYCHEAMNISTAMGDRHAQASTQLIAGQAHWRNGYYESAKTEYTRALAQYRELGDRKGEGIALDGLGEVRRVQGEYRDAIAAFEEALYIASEFHDVRARGDLLNNLGQTYQDMGLFDNAIRCLDEALAIRRRRGDIVRICKTLEVLGEIMRDTGQLTAASDYWSEAYARLKEMGAPHAEEIRVLLDTLLHL